MTNAWIQRLLVIASFALSAYLAYHLVSTERHAWLWLALLPFMMTPQILAISCTWAAVKNRADGDSAATLGQWIRAWWAELLLAIKIFMWWQPFRHRAIADYLENPAGQRGVVLVHGFVCNRAFWTLWMRRLRAQGHAFVSVDLEPAFGSIDSYAQIVERAIAQVEQATGKPPIVIGHSMGGLAIRAWAAKQLSLAGGLDRVHHIFTLGTPHQGTAIASKSHTLNGSQMRQTSPWISNNARQIGAQFAPKATCFYSDCDNIVFPSRTGSFPGANNIHAAGLAHVELAFDEAIWLHCTQALN